MEWNISSEIDISLQTNKSYVKSSSRLVDAIVFIAMGAMAADPMVDFSIASVRKLGKWKGEIYVVTDSPNCFSPSSSAEGDLRVTVISVPPAKNIIEIKALKPIILEYLPEHVAGVLYMDVDILVTRPLQLFLGDLQHAAALMWRRHRELPDFGAFLDAKGHYVGFCSGCEKWHTGVVWMHRDASNSFCMSQWRHILLSGKYSTDQQSLDEAERLGRCPQSLSFPSRHLLFAKDYIGMLLTSGQTFIHLTAAGRLADTDWFYRGVIMPRLRGALQPPLHPNALHVTKPCLGSKSPPEHS
eukprot:CAMPEP_0170088938 /NCGR_PEP_ID=MMETSP0019_2-20121128/23112_1 /TAXON_ID=98059 /ORGANISM="Dinobryon sp., Strain UTEXLB2267" /LENGTH=298 /DNA_ID=CAMNT_0010307481 /DNA_START=162 /DNA_END=1054 /DNA_ORIENTATION=+